MTTSRDHTKTENQTPLEDILDFVINCNYMDIVQKEKGYKIFACTSDSQKWNSPYIEIMVTDITFPEEEFHIEAYYRKEKIYESDRHEVMDSIKEASRDKYYALLKEKDETLKKEFKKIAKDLKKL